MPNPRKPQASTSTTKLTKSNPVIASHAGGGSAVEINKRTFAWGRLAARLALDERLAAVQGIVLTADGKRIDSAGLEWNPRREAVPLLAGADPSRAPRGVFEVTGVSATAALYRRAALEHVAPLGEVFEPSFFAYYEDVDLSLRLARAGWRFACDPAAVARHEGSQTGSRTPWKRAIWVARSSSACERAEPSR